MLLYLLLPSRVMRWADVPEWIATEPGVNLAGLWKSSERAGNDDTVRVALRRGWPTSDGLVVRGDDVVALDRPDVLRQTAADSARSHQALAPHRAFTEHLFPGLHDGAAERDARIDEVSRAAIADAERDVAALLTGDPDDGLVQHWRAVGGTVPALP